MHNVMMSNWVPTQSDIAAGRTKSNPFGLTIDIINGGYECGPNASAAAAANRLSYYEGVMTTLNVEIIAPVVKPVSPACASMQPFA